LALGDSATFGVISPDPWNGVAILDLPYPERWQRLADERLGAGRVEVLNAGVPGYNSYQALLLLRSRLNGLQPDIITVRLGWNDLFLGRGETDAVRESDNRLVRAAEDLLLRSAVYRFSRRLGMEIAHRLEAGRPSLPGPGDWHPAVSVPTFERNLRRIIDIGRSEGAEVWLLTSPDPLVTPQDLERYRAAGPRSSAFLTLGLNRIPSFERLAEIHAQYNDAVRRVAAATGSPLIDMAALYRQRPAADLFGPFDVVHPNEAGHQLEAEILFEQLSQRPPQSRP
jgi:lysophospholipase L1-like esterase